MANGSPASRPEQVVGSSIVTKYEMKDGKPALMRLPKVGARLKMLVHHDDAEREYAYGPAGDLPDTEVGTFSVSLMDESKARGETVISIRRLEAGLLLRVASPTPRTNSPR